jgi:hypothetical protein
MLRRLLVFVAVLGVLSHVAQGPRHNAIVLAGAGEDVILAAFGLGLPIDAAAAATSREVRACPALMATAMVRVLLERVAFRDTRLGQTNYFRARAGNGLVSGACS